MGQRVGLRFGLGALLCLGASSLASVSEAQTIILYENDFERPNIPLAIDCGNSLDGRGINVLYGTESFQFTQEFTVEAVFLHDSKGLYKNQGNHGDYAIGMLSQVQDDKLALAFDSQGNPFINIGLDLSTIDVEQCGGPFGITTPKLRITLLDRPDGVIDYAQKVLDTEEVVGTMAPDAWTFEWTRALVGLSTDGSTDGRVSLVFDLIDGGYAVFDNISITASVQTKVVDIDLDGVVDDQDNCPTTRNADQANADGDASGDACDPDAKDPAVCAPGSSDCKPITTPSEPTDAGATKPAMPDASTSNPMTTGGKDAPSADAGSTYEGDATPSEPSGGCGCMTLGAREGRVRGAGWLWLPALLALGVARRVGRRRRLSPERTRND